MFMSVGESGLTPVIQAIHSGIKVHNVTIDPEGLVVCGPFSVSVLGGGRWFLSLFLD